MNRSLKSLLLALIPLVFLSCENEVNLDVPKNQTQQEQDGGEITTDKTNTADSTENASSNDDNKTPVTSETLDGVSGSGITTTKPIISYFVQAPLNNIDQATIDEIKSRTKYDAREDNLVTEIKDQGRYGTCWAHAAASVIESSMIKKNLATKENVNLSEEFLVYYQYCRVPAPIGGLPTDASAFPTYLTDQILREGGLPSELMNALFAWVGVVDETNYPDITEASILNIDTKEAYEKQATLVTGAATIPANVGIENMENAIAGMKEAIARYGSVATAYNVGYHYSTYYNYTSYGRYYGGRTPGTNHAITIIGWDDDFNEFGNVKPPKSGAWLVRNSYGDDWGDKGYCWLSYYDTTIALRAVYYDVTDVKEYDNNYQYDDASRWSENIGTGSSMELQTANIYTAQGDEDLKAVQFAMVYPNRDYDIDIYLGVKDSPTSGQRVTTVEGSPLPQGRHTIRLSTPIQLKKGDRFSVVVTYRGVNEGETPSAEYESAKNILPGQSFYRLNSSYDWNDMYTEGKGNLRLKVFTKNR